MCVSWKNTLIRIINELWVEKWGVAEQQGSFRWGAQAIHCQRALTIKSQTEIEVWWTPISFVIHKVAMTTNEGRINWIYQASWRKDRIGVNQAPVPARGHQNEAQACQPKKTFPEDAKVVPGFSANWNWLGKDIHCGQLKPFCCYPPPTFGRRFLP